MKTWSLLADMDFHETNPYAEPLSVNEDGRVLRFMLKPGQIIRGHKAPTSPFFAVVIKGEGMFSGEDGKEEKVGPNALLVFAPGENHSVRALGTELVFVGFLQGIPLKPKVLTTLAV